MRRRCFLQLAAAATAGTVLARAIPALAPAIIHHDPSLAVSSWMDEDEVIHVMVEDPHHRSTKKLDISQIQAGRRYKMRLMNATNRDIPLQLPQGRKTIDLKRYSVVEARMVL